MDVTRYAMEEISKWKGAECSKECGSECASGNCPIVVYYHGSDGECRHRACEGDMSLLGCGEIVDVV